MPKRLSIVVPDNTAHHLNSIFRHGEKQKFFLNVCNIVSNMLPLSSIERAKLIEGRFSIKFND